MKTKATKTRGLTSEIMAAMQKAAAAALDGAGVDTVTRQAVLLSPAFNRYCLKAARELLPKVDARKV